MVYSVMSKLERENAAESYRSVIIIVETADFTFSLCKPTIANFIILKQKFLLSSNHN